MALHAPLRFCLILGALLACSFFSVPVFPVYGEETVDDLQAQIADRQAKIKEIEAQIIEYEIQLNKIGADKKTLQNEISQLDTTRKKLTSQIASTQNKISAANLKLSQLSLSIADKEDSIWQSEQVIARSLRAINIAESQTLTESILAAQDFSDFWQDADELGSLQGALSERIAHLTDLKNELSADKDETDKQKKTLVSLNNELGGQRSVLDNTRTERNQVLSQTQNKESTFQKLLAEKIAAKEQFEKELADFEGNLAYSGSAKSVPSPGSGVLKFPFSDDFMQNCVQKEKTFKNIYCVTQYFGNTPFARSGAYNGSGHNGIDFGASTGTRILSALSGTVTATGNTDTVRGCYSYGKWVLIKHNNGLSTLYSHLSVISVSQGQSLDTGDLVGFSGATGYATGPHLHFTVYASDGVRLVRMGDIKAKTNCANATIPVAPTEAYLNPMQYL